MIHVQRCSPVQIPVTDSNLDQAIDYLDGEVSGKFVNEFGIDTHHMNAEPLLEIAKECKAARQRMVSDSIGKCPRCGRPHPKLNFREMYETGGYTHMTTCPTNGQPILMVHKIS